VEQVMEMALPRVAFIAAFSIALVGCVSTQEMPLAQNMVRIDTRASGLIYANRAVPETMRAAAKATLAHGYEYFKLADANLGQGSEYAGSIGNTSGYYGGGGFSAWGSSTELRRPVTASAATVIMFHKNDPQAKDAFSAEDILTQYPQ
jgi:hypothetical protein